MFPGKAGGRARGGGGGAAAAAGTRRLAGRIFSIQPQSESRAPSNPHSAAGLILVQQDDPPQIRIQLRVVSLHVLS
eukprot:COSAG01_NODE_56668_length_316_cov_40.926267_1_plen_75_part_01